MSDTSHEVPGGWLTTTLKEIAEIVGGITKDSKKSQGSGFREVPYLRVANVQRGRLELTQIKLISASEADIAKLSLQPGDMLLNEGGDRDKLGRGWIWQGQLPVCIHQNHVFRARLRSREIDPVYIAHFTNSMAQAYFAEHGSQTTNLASISLTKLGSLPILLPPAKEQTRIVTKLEELLSDLDAGVAELKAAQKKLAQYRQSLLKAAAEGALTADWRAQNPPGETGAQLLQRILQERRARWEAKQIAKFESQGKAPPKDWQKKYPEPVQPDTTDLPALPQGWVWGSLDALIAEGPQNGLYLPSDRYGSGTPILRIDDYQIGWHRSRAALNLVNADRATCQTYALATGDLVINRVNSMTHLGKSLLVTELLNGVLFESNMMRSSLSSLASGEFVAYYLGSDIGRARLTRDAKWAVNQASINQQDVRRTPVPIAPAAEQVAIAAILTDQLNAAVQQGIAIDQSLQQSTAQRQNILRAAFSGQLVPQDPNDEPASVLLARIRAERANHATGKKPRGRKSVAGI